jgi:serine/threonine protein kinase
MAVVCAMMTKIEEDVTSWGVLKARQSVFQSQLFTGMSVRAAHVLVRHFQAEASPECLAPLTDCAYWMIEADAVAQQTGRDELFTFDDYKWAARFSSATAFAPDLAAARAWSCTEAAAAAHLTSSDPATLSTTVVHASVQHMLQCFGGSMNYSHGAPVHADAGLAMARRVRGLLDLVSPMVGVTVLLQNMALPSSALLPGVMLVQQRVSALQPCVTLLQNLEPHVSPRDVWSAVEGFPLRVCAHTELLTMVQEKLRSDSMATDMWASMAKDFSWLAPRRYGYHGSMTGEGSTALTEKQCSIRYCTDMEERQRRRSAAAAAAAPRPAAALRPAAAAAAAVAPRRTNKELREQAQQQAAAWAAKRKPKVGRLGGRAMEPTAMLGQGTFGCVFRPPIPCTRTGMPAKVRASPHDFVSKLMFGAKSAEDMAKEDASNRLIASLDPNHEFTLQAVTTCQADLSGVDASVLRECDGMTARASSQIISEYGGTELLKVPLEDTLTMLVGLQPLFEVGLPRLAESSWCHLDLKPANILYNEGRHRCVMIDFGLASGFEKVYSYQSLLQHQYPYYPPEFKVIASGREPIRAEEWPTLCPVAYSRFFGGDALAPVWEGWVHECEAVELVLGRPYRATVPEREDAAMFRALLCNKVDVYAMGATVVEMWCRMGRPPTNDFERKLLMFGMALMAPLPFMRPCPFAAAQLWGGVTEDSVHYVDFEAAVHAVRAFEMEASLAMCHRDMRAALATLFTDAQAHLHTQLTSLQRLARYIREA